MHMPFLDIQPFSLCYMFAQDCLFHDLHELLVSREVMGLFEKEEVEGIASQLHGQGGLRGNTTDSESWGASRHNGDTWNKFVEVN